MVDIKIYGASTPSFLLVKSKLTEILNLASIPFTISEVTIVSEILKENIVSVPAIKVNGILMFEIKSNDQFNYSLRQSILQILKINKYGKMVKIIVPTDFSETSLNAYNFANHLAKDTNGVIFLTHIFNPPISDVDQFAFIDDSLIKVYKDRLDELVLSVDQDRIGTFMAEPLVEGIFKVGIPKMELIELSKEPNSVMVMGTSGEGDLFKKVFGSLTLEMIESSYCPIYLVPPGSHYSDSKEIIYLSEDLKNDVLHLLYVGNLCKSRGAVLKLIHYQDANHEPFNVSDTIDVIDSYFPELVYHIEIIDTEDTLKNIKKLLTGDSNNLVVMSTKHRNIFEKMFHNSMTEFAALHCNSPILILNQQTT